jgi:outer membrane protein insertion porin family
LGHLRASFGEPIAKPATKGGCEGVDLTIPVEEGAVYSWVKAEWFGNQVLSTKELDDALGMKAGEVANGKKFDAGLKEVQNAYGKHGYILIRLNPAAEFDEGAPKVTFKIAITEGPQYRMGTIEFKGFSASDAATLGKKWSLKSGDVYDRSYAGEFLRSNTGEIMSRLAQERLAQRKPVPNLGLFENVNSQALTVNLVMELKN